MRADLRFVALTLCAALASTAAAAQDTPDTSTVKFGPVGITPTLNIRNAGVDNNVFNEAENPRSDFTATISPGAKVVFQPRRLTLSLDESVDYVYFEKYTSERSTNNAATVSASLDLDYLRPFVSARGIDTSDRLDAEVDARARRHETQYSAGVAVHAASHTTFSVTVRRARRAFDQNDPNVTFRGENLATAFDGTTQGVEGSFDLELTPLTTLSLAAGEDRDTFDSAPERNSRSLRVTPAVTFRPGAVLTGSLRIGYRRFTPDSALVQPFSGLVAEGQIETTIVGRYHLATGITRDLHYSYERDTPYFLLTGLTETLTTALPAGFDVVVNGAIQRLDYRGVSTSPSDPGVDRVYLYGAGAGYRIRSRARIALTTEWTDRHSPRGTERGYSNHRIFATLTWGLPQ